MLSLAAIQRRVAGALFRGKSELQLYPHSLLLLRPSAGPQPLALASHWREQGSPWAAEDAGKTSSCRIQHAIRMPCHLLPWGSCPFCDWQKGWGCSCACLLLPAGQESIREDLAGALGQPPQGELAGTLFLCLPVRWGQVALRPFAAT